MACITVYSVRLSSALVALVEDEHLRIVIERARNADPLALAAAQRDAAFAEHRVVAAFERLR
jgi:hypothetical protein